MPFAPDVAWEDGSDDSLVQDPDAHQHAVARLVAEALVDVRLVDGISQEKGRGAHAVGEDAAADREAAHAGVRFPETREEGDVFTGRSFFRGARCHLLVLSALVLVREVVEALSVGMLP